MNIKKAIEYLRKLKTPFDTMEKIIELLRRGEKFENLFNEVEESFQNDLDLAEWVDDIKQKYFPKEE